MNDSAPLPDNDKIMSDVEQDPQPISVRDRMYLPVWCPKILCEHLHDVYIIDTEIANKVLPDLDLEVEAFDVFHWEVSDWRGLDKRTHSPEFEIGGYKWYMLFLMMRSSQILVLITSLLLSGRY
jgi:hypothetical protein